MLFYANSLKIENASIAPLVAKDARVKVIAISEEGKVELKLIAAVTSMGQNDHFHPTVVAPSEELPKGFLRSSTELLINNAILKVIVNQEIVCKETKHLQKLATVAYFMESKPPQKALALWIKSLQVALGDWWAWDVILDVDSSKF